MTCQRGGPEKLFGDQVLSTTVQNINQERNEAMFEDPKDGDVVVFSQLQLEDPATLTYALLLCGKYTMIVKDTDSRECYRIAPIANLPAWQRCWEVTKPGMYLCKHETGLLGNSFLLYVQESSRGLVFNKTRDSEGEVFAQTVNCEGNRQVWFYGPVPAHP
jgi:hypothetical protein